MRKILYTLFSILLFSAICAAQTLHVIETNAGNVFSASDITVEVQDTVGLSRFAAEPLIFTIS